MSYQTPTALLISEIDQAIHDGGFLSMINQQWVEESYDHCVGILRAVNEIALHCDFKEVDRGAQKLAMVNQTLIELTQTLGLMRQTRTDLIARETAP